MARALAEGTSRLPEVAAMEHALGATPVMPGRSTQDAIVAGIGWAAHAVFVHAKWGWAAEAAVIGVLVAQRSLHDHVAAVGRALAQEGLEAGRREVAHIVGRDPDTLDAHGVARAAIESLFENFGDGVVAPVFW